MGFDNETWKWIATSAATAAAGLAAFVWKDTKQSIQQKADKEDVQRIEDEQSRHRDHLAKIYEKLEQHTRRDEDHFRELFTTIAANHSEILRELGKKVDR